MELQKMFRGMIWNRTVNKNFWKGWFEAGWSFKRCLEGWFEVGCNFKTCFKGWTQVGWRIL